MKTDGFYLLNPINSVEKLPLPNMNIPTVEINLDRLFPQIRISPTESHNLSTEEELRLQNYVRDFLYSENSQWLKKVGTILDKYNEINGTSHIFFLNIEKF